MTRLQAWLLHASNVLVGGTGLVYAWMRFALEPQDAFAVVNHPLQPLFRDLHVLLAPVLVFAIGLVWQGHVDPGLRSRVRLRRASGLTLVLLAAPMIASGYLLQTAVGEGWRTAWTLVHLSTSAAWLTAYLAHLFARRRAVEVQSGGSPSTRSSPPDAAEKGRHGSGRERAPTPNGAHGQPIEVP